ncbi:SagB/ThcOx family dehydrogenase [Candidatus Fermentibacteria bacterium]|nr:SagB/ThcOx family dehydrogenase [Candidatus Fermentibacteria bacterium]
MGIGHDFMQMTRYENLEPSDQTRGVSQPPLELAAPHEEAIPLPDPAGLDRGAMTLREVIARRRSIREYAETPLTTTDLAFLLWATQGVTRVVSRVATLRTVPSAGARHALETFVLVNRVTGFTPGLYRYLALSHAMTPRDTDPAVARSAVQGCLGQQFVASCAAAFIWAAVPYRMTWRYGERGYRYLHLDAGHAAQNLYLAAESLGCGACAIAAFDDDAMSRLIGADGSELFVIYVATVGYPRR